MPHQHVWRYYHDTKRFLFLFLALVLAVGSGLAALSTSAEKSALEVPPDAAAGFYIVGSQNLNPAQYANAGDMQFFWWRYSTPIRGFSMAALDSYLTAHAVNGKKVGIAIVPAEGRAAAARWPRPVSSAIPLAPP